MTGLRTCRREQEGNAELAQRKGGMVSPILIALVRRQFE